MHNLHILGNVLEDVERHAPVAGIRLVSGGADDRQCGTFCHRVLYIALQSF